MLSPKQLKDVCLLGGNHLQCRYLAQDDDQSKWFCLKKSSRKQEIDEEIVEHLKELNKKGIDPIKQGIPLGDNCSGYPILKHKEQGFDKK